MKLKQFSLGFDHVIDFFAYICAIMIVLLMIGVTINVIVRFMGHPILGVEEISEYILLWFTFLGTTWVLKRDKHVKIDVLFNYFNHRQQDILTIIFSVTLAIVFACIFYFGATSCIDYIQRDVWMPQILKLPKGLVWSVVPFGSLLLTLQFIRITYQRFISLVRG